MNRAMGLQCRECRDSLAHCHGTIIYHPRRRAECTEDDCDGPEILPHTFRVDCAAVGCRCGDLEAVAV